MKATSETGAIAHDEVQELLGSYVAQRLPEAQAEAVRAHLAECDDCRSDLALEWRLRAAAPPEPQGLDPERAFARLAARLPEPARQRAAPPGLGERLKHWLGGGAGWMPYALAGQSALLVLLGVRLLAADPVPQQFHALSSGAPPGSANLVLMFRADATALQVERALRAGGARVIDGPTVTGAYLLQVRGDEQSALASLRANPAVQLAEPMSKQP